MQIIDRAKLVLGSVAPAVIDRATIGNIPR
jgi:hypothetical protein